MVATCEEVTEKDSKGAHPFRSWSSSAVCYVRGRYHAGRRAVLSLKRIHELPPNFGEFAEEVAQGLAGLYGPHAAAAYREIAEHGVRAAIEHPSVDAIAVWEGKGVAGFLLGTLREDVGQVSFIHVLERYAGRGVEERLLKECVRTFRAGGVEGIVSECIPLCPLDLEGTYRALGFDAIERSLMAAPLNAPALAREGSATSLACRRQNHPALAETIVAAYEGHPGRRLHVEVTRKEFALSFLEGVASGNYGKVRPEYLRYVERDGRYVGGIVGCEVAPDYGFVLQVFVRPEYDRRGIGTQLLRDLAWEFRKAGLDNVALGVTLSNPAARLYERLGFHPLRPVTAYVWWRP